MNTLEELIPEYNQKLSNIHSVECYREVEKIKRKIEAVMEHDLENCDEKNEIIAKLKTNNSII
jgi:hypothetical protein